MVVIDMVHGRMEVVEEDQLTDDMVVVTVVDVRVEVVEEDE